MRKTTTKEQIKLPRATRAFIDYHGILPTKLFDANWTKPSVYGPVMKASGYVLAFNVTPCKYYGHELRTRKGACVICNPSTLGFLQRYRNLNHIYIAQAGRRKISKIGITSDVPERMKLLNKTGYAGFSNWNLFYDVFLPEAGVIENLVCQILRDKEYDVVTEDIVNGTREAFRCSPDTMLDALGKAVLLASRQ